jgi:hypothetical protein
MSRAKFLIRFPPKEPSIFRIPDDPEAEATGPESIALALEPRLVDQGQSSFWQVINGHQENHVKASFAAQRQNKQNLFVLRLPRKLVEQVNVGIKHDPVLTTFACIADLHHLLNFDSRPALNRLAEELWKALQSDELARNDVYHKVKKSEIGQLLSETYQSCIHDGEMPDITRAQQWAQDLLQAVD